MIDIDSVYGDSVYGPGLVVLFGGRWNIIYSVDSNLYGIVYNTVDEKGINSKISEDQLIVLVKSVKLAPDSRLLSAGNPLNYLFNREVYKQQLISYLENPSNKPKEKEEEEKRIDFTNDREIIL